VAGGVIKIGYDDARDGLALVRALVRADEEAARYLLDAADLRPVAAWLAYQYMLAWLAEFEAGGGTRADVDEFLSGALFAEAEAELA
jgi:hypothetical protein